MAGTTTASSDLASSSSAVINCDFRGEEADGKLSVTSTFTPSSSITLLIVLTAWFGSSPGSRRPSISAYAAAGITLVCGLADNTVGVNVSRTIAFCRGTARKSLTKSGLRNAVLKFNNLGGPPLILAIALK